MERSSTATPPQIRVAHLQTPERQDPVSTGRGGFPFARTLFISLLVLAVLAIALPLLYSVSHDGRVYRGVSVLGTDLGGMTRAEAQAALARASAGYPQDKIVVSYGDRTQTFSAADLGVAVDVDGTLDRALSVGRDGSVLSSLGEQMSALFGGNRVTPVLKHDSALVNKVVDSLAATWDKQAVDSKLQQNANGTVELTASSSGTVLDRDATSRNIEGALGSVPFATVQVSMVTQPPKVTEQALDGARSQALLLTGQPVALTAGDQAWTIQPADLRKMLTLNTAPDGTADPALDTNALQAYLTSVAADIKVEPEDATLTVGRGTVTLTPDVAGTELDLPAAVAAIQKAAEQSGTDARTVTLPTRSIQASVLVGQLQPLYDKVNALVSVGIRYRFRDDGYTVKGSAVTSFLNVAPAQGGPGPLQVVVDEDALANSIAGVAYYINRASGDARFKMVNGVPTKIADSKEGYKVDVQQSVKNAVVAINSYPGGDKLQVDLSVAVTQPTVTDADLANISTPDLLGKAGQTSFQISSAERAWNVSLGASNINGSLIPPGGVFSTDDAIGDLTLAAGFKMGYAIQSDGQGGLTTVPAEAGGICQVSTTLFHAVFWSGLPIVERHWHSYWIGLYGLPPSGLQGLDATISPPDLDFRFKNTTGHWLRIEATTENKILTVKLYGTNPGWKVNVSNPVISNIVKTDPTPIYEKNSQIPAGKQVLVEHAQDGFDSSIRRVVTDASGSVIDDWTAKSHYEPAHERYLVGTGQ